MAYLWRPLVHYPTPEPHFLAFCIEIRKNPPTDPLFLAHKPFFPDKTTQVHLLPKALSLLKLSQLLLLPLRVLWAPLTPPLRQREAEEVAFLRQGAFLLLGRRDYFSFSPILALLGLFFLPLIEVWPPQGLLRAVISGHL